MNELWEEICFILRDIPASSNEDVYEQKIIQSLEKIDWSRFQQEIILKQNIQLGSAGEIIPDIVVKLSGKNAFVIEVKKPSVDVENSSHKNQLFSYMRQLKLANGLLIGNKIQIYYDGQLNKAEEPILLKSIEIDKEDKNGLVLFIKLFQKSTFSHQKLEKFAEEILKEITAESHKKKLHNLLLSSDYQSKIQQFIVNDLQQNWDSETIEDVLEQMSISIVPKITEPNPTSESMPLSYCREKNQNRDTKKTIEMNKVQRRLEQWAQPKKQKQINAKILNAFLELRRSGRKGITEKDIQNKSYIPTFKNNFTQMKEIGEKIMVKSLNKEMIILKYGSLSVNLSPNMRKLFLNVGIYDLFCISFSVMPFLPDLLNSKKAFNILALICFCFLG